MCILNSEFGRTCRWLICGSVIGPDQWNPCVTAVSEANRRRSKLKNGQHVAEAIWRYD